MKKILATLVAIAWVGAAVNSYATATIDMNNLGGNLIYWINPTTKVKELAPAGVWVEVLGGALGGALAPVSNTDLQAKSQLLDAGLFYAGVGLLPAAVADSADANFQLRAWPASFASYDAAAADPAAPVLATAIFKQKTGSWNPASQPPVPATGPQLDLVPLGELLMKPVPEPSTIVLGVLGAAALLLRRRK